MNDDERETNELVNKILTERGERINKKHEETENKMATIIKKYAKITIIVVVIYLILMLLQAVVEDEEIDEYAIYYVALFISAVVNTIFCYALAEIINLLQKIVNNTSSKRE